MPDATKKLIRGFHHLASTAALIAALTGSCLLLPDARDDGTSASAAAARAADGGSNSGGWAWVEDLLERLSMGRETDAEVSLRRVLKAVYEGREDKIGDHGEDEEEDVFSRIGLVEDADLFRDTFASLAAGAVAKHRLRPRPSSSACPSEQSDPYVSALEGLLDDPIRYDRKGEQDCPVNFVFYFEPGTVQNMDAFLGYYRSLGTRCVLFVGPAWGTKGDDAEVLRGEGYDVLSVESSSQHEVFLAAIRRVRESHGNSSIVDLNDVDHFVSWHLDGKFRRYSSYSDAVMVYNLDLLAASGGCPDETRMRMRFSLPCTCFMEDNSRYVSNDEETVFTQYGISNIWHDSASFYVPGWNPRSLATQFASAGGITGVLAAHAFQGKDRTGLARHAGVVHLRREDGGSAMAKYVRFLLNKAAPPPQFAIEDALRCATAETKELIEMDCFGEKELVNILSIVYQNLKCLEAGYDEGHCQRDLGCCLTVSDATALVST